MDKLPPIEKIYEAYSAIADKRVTLKENIAIVTSSDYKKEYTVSWENNIYSSNDNASYWQGYVGYPIIAVLFLQNKLNLNNKIAHYFKGINWKKLNIQYKRNYTKVINKILRDLENNSVNSKEIQLETLKVFEQLKCLDIVNKRGKLRPPSSS